MNVNLAIPFIACPMINLFLSSFVMRIGLVAAPTGAAISSFMPFGFYQALNNGSWTGVVWAIILVMIDMVIYYPFFKRQDSINLKNENQLEIQEG